MPGPVHPFLFLTTPLLKIPLLVSNAACTYYGMTRPNQPRESEKERAPPEDFFTHFQQLYVAATTTAKCVLCGFALGEAALLLAQQSPYASQAAHYVAIPSLRLTPASATGCLLGIAGGLIRVWCHRTLGRLFTWQLIVRDEHELVTSGPYAIVRHPSYTGWLLIIGGNAALFLSRGSLFAESRLCESASAKAAVGVLFAWCAWSTAALIKRMSLEDEMLKREFGLQWEDWAKKTRYRLIPYIY